LSPVNSRHRQFLEINTSIFETCQMFILYFIKFSQLEFVLQVHINFFMLVLFYSFCSNLFIFFNLKKMMRKNKNN
jgi:hypothetical protein